MNKSCLAILLFALTPELYAQSRLISPFKVIEKRDALVQTGVTKTVRYTCPALISPVVSFTAGSRYVAGDPTHSIVNESAEAAYSEAADPVRDFQFAVVKASDAYAMSTTKPQAHLQCALSHMYHWASADALLGERSLTGYMLSSSSVIAVASAYLKIQDAYTSKTATAEELEKMKVIRSWLRKQALSIADYFSNVGGNTSQGNLRYSAGLAVALSSIITQKSDSFAWAMDTLRIGLSHIQPEGYLPIELSRGSRALSYHFVATAPLVMLFEIGHLNGAYFSEKDLGKVDHLINFIYKSYKDPNFMLSIDPSLPTQMMNFSCSEFSFFEIYQYRASILGRSRSIIDRFISQKRTECGDLYQTTLGGNMTYFFGR